MRTILIPLPSYGFDPTESGVPWRRLKTAGHKITFSTPDGQAAEADRRIVTGVDLGIWKNVLMADQNGVSAYIEMSTSDSFLNPLAYKDIDPQSYDALLLPGGHDKGMRPYLESKSLQSIVADFFEKNKPVGAICHGTLLVARSFSPTTMRSVLWGRKTTGLTKRQELTAYLMTAPYLGDYYRTYPMWMADEVRSLLKSPKDFDGGPDIFVPLRRDSPNSLESAFVLRDGNYLSARWPGDAHRFGYEFEQMLKS